MGFAPSQGIGHYPPQSQTPARFDRFSQSQIPVQTHVQLPGQFCKPPPPHVQYNGMQQFQVPSHGPPQVQHTGSHLSTNEQIWATSPEYQKYWDNDHFCLTCIYHMNVFMTLTL